MKGRESGMPSKEVWEGFFNSTSIFRYLGLDKNVHDVAEFGCVYGTFTIAAARIVKGTVYALDIDPGMIAVTKKEATKE
jgi:ribosomal protein L11 methylase PrmA